MYEHNHLIVLYNLTQARIAFTYPSIKLGDSHRLLQFTLLTLLVGARDSFIRLLLLLLLLDYYFLLIY